MRIGCNISGTTGVVPICCGGRSLFFAWFFQMMPTVKRVRFSLCVGGCVLEPVECPHCGRVVDSVEELWCPWCNRVLPRFSTHTRVVEDEVRPHPDPIKQEEAKLAARFRQWFIEDLPRVGGIETSNYSIPLEKISQMPLSGLVEEADRYLVSTTSSGRFAECFLKIVIVGKRGVGVSSLLNRLTPNAFSPDYRQSIGTSFGVSDFTMLDTKSDVESLLKVTFWTVDAGARVRAFRRHLFAGASGVAYVFSLTDVDSFEMLPDLVRDIEIFVGPVPGIIVGNKADLVGARKVSSEKAMEFAEEVGLPYVETSIVDGQDLYSVMQFMIPASFNYFMDGIASQTPATQTQLAQPSPKEKIESVPDFTGFLSRDKRIDVTESGYATIKINRPLNLDLIKQFFHDQDLYAEEEQVSVKVKKHGNILLFREDENRHRIAFGPNLDEELLSLVYRYIREVLGDDGEDMEAPPFPFPPVPPTEPPVNGVLVREPDFEYSNGLLLPIAGKKKR